MLLEITEKIILENAFEQKKKKSGFNLTLGSALIGLPTTDPWLHWLYIDLYWLFRKVLSGQTVHAFP